MHQRGRLHPKIQPKILSLTTEHLLTRVYIYIAWLVLVFHSLLPLPRDVEPTASPCTASTSHTGSLPPGPLEPSWMRRLEECISHFQSQHFTKRECPSHTYILVSKTQVCLRMNGMGKKTYIKPPKLLQRHERKVVASPDHPGLNT